MTALLWRFYPFILFFCVRFTHASLERRFSDFKRCADDECSMLLCRGKAAKDFSGPDCRFLSFKKGETIYVYYKLSGQRSDVWAGSVGSNFGYFPKDFLNINHIYTDKEIEVSAEETDFVCFDTGLDKFESYDVDALLSSSLFLNEGDSQREKPEGLGNTKDSEDMKTLLKESPIDTNDGGEDTDLLPQDKAEESDIEDDTDLEYIEPNQLPTETVALDAVEDKENNDGGATTENNKSSTDESFSDGQILTKQIDEPSSKDGDALQEEDHVTEVKALPELKTTLGTTFDAVMSDDEDTERVTLPFDEHQKIDKQQSDHIEEAPKEPALLTAATELPYFEERITDPESKSEEIPIEPTVEKQENDRELTKDGMWSSLGDTVFKIVSGGERTDLSDDTEDDDEDEEEEEEDDKEEVADADRNERGLDNHIRVQDSEIKKDAGEAKHSNKDSITENPLSSKVSKADEIKHHNIDFATEDEEVSEQASKMFKPDDVGEELVSTDDSLNVVKMIINDSIDSELDASEDGKQVIEETVQKVIENIQFSKSEPLDEDGAQNAPQVGDMYEESDQVSLVENADQPEPEKQSDIHEITDEKISSVKNNIVNLLDSTLKAEHEAEENEQEPDVYEDNEDIEELLEDENAVLSSIPGKTEEVKESTANSKLEKELENDPLATDETPEKIMSTHKNENTNSNMVPSLDSLHKDDDAEPLDGPGEFQHDPVISKAPEEIASSQTNEGENSNVEPPLDSLVSPDEEKNDAQSVNGLDKIQPDPVHSNEPEEIKSTQKSGDINGSTNSNTVPSLDLLGSHQDKENDTQGTDGQGEIQQDPVISKDPEYSDSVLRLTLLRDHFKDNELERIQRYLDLRDLYRVEAMFADLDQELRSVRESNSETSYDIERTLEDILEVSENSILDEIEKMLDAQEQKARDRGQQVDPVMFDEEAAILDDFQEFAFYLRQKYSAVSDSVPLVEESQSHLEMENVNASDEELTKRTSENIKVNKKAEDPEVHQETEESPNVNVEEGETQSPDMGLGEDGGHFNKNKDIQLAFEGTEEVQRGPQAIQENPLDITFGFEMEQSSGSLESQSASDLYDNKAKYDQADSSSSDHVWGWLVVGSEFLGMCAENMISSLPEEWQPGPTFHGLPWKPVVTTAVVGILTMFMFIWRTILAVKGRTYLLTEKQLSEKIQQLVSEKSDVLLKITELNNKIKQQEEKQKNSEKSESSTHKEFERLKTRYQDLCNQREELSVNVSQLGQKIADTQEENRTLNEKMLVMHQRIEEHQNSLRQYEEERAKIQVLMDEAKLREDALKAQVLSFEKDNSALKEQKKNLLRDAKDWQEKHEQLGEEIKVYHKTQKDLEDSLVHKENEIDVLSSCIAELKGLEAMDFTELQKGDAKLANDKKGDPIKLRLKQMMDVSRIKATLSIVEEERNRCLENFWAEQKARQELEEQFQKVVHEQTKLKNEKTHLESQYNNLQQRLEITTELYQQKENVLQQKLTQEELERREKETKLSEVDGRALQTEEELNSLRQKVKDMQDEMQQNERALKSEIAVQEKKAHENWLKARASERALIEERRESANLRQKIVECSDRMTDLEHKLYKSGAPDRHISLRRGDSYGPSPVSGGAPSPPLMIEGPGRPPSAPVGRRNESFGPQPPPDPHGRFSDLGHPLPTRPDMQMFAPRTSSPCTQDGSTVPVDAKAEAFTDTTEAFQMSKSQSQGSFLPSPIRDSPGPISNAPPKPYGPQTMGGLPPPNGAHPPMIRPPNGHPSMVSPGPSLGPDPHFRPPHMDAFGPPLRPFGPVPPPFARGPPLRDHPPMRPPLPPFGAHDFPPDFAGPRDFPFPPRPFPPGSLPPPGAMVPPPFGSRDLRGAAPHLGQSSRDSELTHATGHATDSSSQQGATQDTATSGMAEP
ncbi:transport and Golgi organization protein 1 homolog isoform X1 [Astyanax mexicanus]|uniref:transport and Golgi organization protein 1 homolog isoform X1 n=1 Tax=Astyanax mexicanus TaxID=7994 RepID=UPI0020CAB729|nr:transport and Golgi organization protein 1 homolog isoform X1 [Astyanax mexicanus]